MVVAEEVGTVAVISVLVQVMSTEGNVAERR